MHKCISPVFQIKNYNVSMLQGILLKYFLLKKICLNLINLEKLKQTELHIKVSKIAKITKYYFF